MMAPTTPTKPASSKEPTTLLWAYELQRENKILAQHLDNANEQLEAGHDLSRVLHEHILTLSNIIDSIDSTLDNGSQSGSTEQKKSPGHLKRSYSPFHGYTQALERENSDISACIAHLESLHDSHQPLPGPAMITPPSSAGSKNNSSGHKSKRVRNSKLPRPSGNKTTLTQTPRVAAPPTPTPKRAKTIDQSLNTDTAQPQSPGTAKILEHTLLGVLKQNGRTLQEYFEAAISVRDRSLRSKQGSDTALIKVFIAGCEKRVHRLRLKHSLRKDGWTWPWLTQHVNWLLMEEDYLEKQEFALVHQFEDGSVLWPDGSRRHRFIALPPITEEDFTSTDGK
ncbi:hypothetical protein NUU61_000686 [Penicillium alfredii]|uniref:Uncharacterized protein n=1 Tax=Penicillium alfredii TaxID=1506179 RepID=A0A9W9GAE2_9EURO|nr:uncharacterized protein NUU61_000686 [Penicillium alfredii]KAJ5114927.1 hypothetical protein NUU61_000686 [Penicillium alfredii]